MLQWLVGFWCFSVGCWTWYDVFSVVVVETQGQESSVSLAVANNSEVGPSNRTLSPVRRREYWSPRQWHNPDLTVNPHNRPRQHRRTRSTQRYFTSCCSSSPFKYLTCPLMSHNVRKGPRSVRLRASATRWAVDYAWPVSLLGATMHNQEILFTACICASI